MKKFIFATLILSTLSLAINSCKKEESTPDKSMSAKIGTYAFTANNITGSLAGSELIVMGQLTSGSSVQQSIGLVVANYFTSGTYHTGVFDIGTEATATCLTGSTTKTIVSGTITLTTADAKSAAGNFSFVCSDSTTITDGFFHVVW